MPHFVIDCSESIIEIKSPDEIMQTVFDTAASTELFEPSDIKVRINPFQLYKVGNSKDDFLHVFANIMEGRTVSQKKDLAEKIVSRLKLIFPDVPVISINVRDFEKATYCNKLLV